MNKKILLLITICIFSILAFTVSAGDPSCGLGGCAAAAVTASSVSTGGVNLTSQSWTPNTISVVPFCGNITGTNCTFEYTSFMNLTRCDATADVDCDLNTVEVLNQFFSNTSNVSNFSYVAVANGSAAYAAIGVEMFGGVPYYDLFVGFNLDSGPVIKTYTPWHMNITWNYTHAVDIDEIKLSGGGNGFLVSVIGVNNSLGNIMPIFMMFDSSGNLIETLGVNTTLVGQPFPRNYWTPFGVTIDEQSPSQFAHVWYNDDAGTDFGYTFAIDLAGNPMNLSTSTANEYGDNGGGMVIDILPTSEVVSRGGRQVTKNAVLAYIDTQGPGTKMIVSSNEWPDTLAVNATAIERSGVDNDAIPMAGAHIIDKDHMLVTAMNTTTLGIPTTYLSFNLIVDHSSVTPVAPSKGKSFSLGLYPPTYGGIETCSGTTLANVKATMVDYTGTPYFLVFDSLGGILASWTASVNALRASDTVCVNPAVHAVQLRNLIYNGTNQTASLIVVTQGSNLIDSFYIYNMTVDDGAILAANATGGHSGNYMYYVLGGRSTNNTGIFLDYFNTSLGLSAVNPNGTFRFTTDKQVRIQTLHPDINILNFQLTWQNFSGVFDTSAGSCIGCRFDLDNGTCQAEVEKVWGMFKKYRLDIELTTASALDFQNITMYCRDANQTILAHPNCSGLFPYNYNSTGCVQWQATAGRSWLSTGPNGAAGLGIDLNGTTSINITMGNITPFDGCEQIACEVYGEWEPGNTQNFVMNKTITVTAY